MDHPVLPKMPKSNVKRWGLAKYRIWAKSDEKWAF